MTPEQSSKGEVLIRVTSQHWVKYVFPAFVYLIFFSLSILLFVLAGITAHHSMWLSHVVFIAALVLFLGAHHWFFLVLLCESASHIIITNNRVIWLHDRLFLDEEMTEFAFQKMKSVEVKKKGLLQTVFRYGKLKFEGGAGIPLVPHPNSVAKDVEQAMGLI